jgi:aflatoxin B synthase
MAFPSIAILSLALLVLYVFKRALLGRRLRGPLPPGPQRKPILGSIMDLPPKGEREWVYWMKHKEVYGTYPTCQMWIWL